MKCFNSLTLILVLAWSTTLHAQSYAIVDVNVVAMETEEVLAHQTVVVRDGVIVEIAPTSLVGVPLDAELISGENQYLVPGLHDMHVHIFGEDDLYLFLANGVTSVRSLWGQEQLVPLYEAVGNGAVDGPRIYSAGALIDGDPPIWPNCAVVTTVEQAVAEVRKQHKEGWKFIKVYNRLEPEVYDAIVKTAAEVGMPVIGHVPDKVGLQSVLDAGQQSIEHLNGYMIACQGDDSPVTSGNEWSNPIEAVVAFFDRQKLRQYVRETVDAGTWNCPTMVVYQSPRTNAEHEAYQQWESMAYVSPMIQQFWASNQPKLPDAANERVRAHRAADAIRGEITLALHKAGAGILLGTDTPNPFVVPGYSIHRELQNFVDAGLTPFEALQAGTSNAARYLDVGDSLGMLKPGYLADMVLVNENPLEDIRAMEHVAGVMTRGKWMSRDSIDQRLNELEASYDTDIGGGDGGAVDRFADMPALPTDGNIVMKDHYEVGMGGMAFGEERFVVRRLDNGHYRIDAQSTYMPWNAPTSFTGAFDADYVLQHATVTLGNDSLDVKRDGDSMHVSGTLFGKDVDDTFDAPGDDIVVVQSFAFESFVAWAAKQKSADGSAVQRKHSLNYYPAYSAVRMAVTPSVDSDGAVVFTTDDPSLSELRYSFDASGYIVRIEITSAAGVMSAERVSR